MPVLTLKEAVARIKQTCSVANRRERSDPFFFMVGAGVSHPPIPLASDIIAHCREEAAYQPRLKPDATGMEQYSGWFEAAYPDRQDRQEYLRGVIKDKWVSTASLRLAHLMTSRRISNLAVTTNFDDLLSRALILFGHHPVICDHPETILKVDLSDRTIPQVVHLHGSSQFYDCMNLSSEIADRAGRPNASPFSMADFLSELLNQRSPIVVGYSGWENDVFMTSLCRRLQRSLPHSVYWFCYQETEKDRLPEALRLHPDVFLVCPPPEHAPGGSSGGEQALGVSGSETDKGTRLTATNIFESLIHEFKITSPEITQDPMRFFAAQLKRVIPPSDTNEPDVYFISQAVSRLEEAAQREQENYSDPARPLDEIRDALRRADYSTAIRLGTQMNLTALDSGQLKSFLKAMCSSGAGLLDDSEEELQAYDLTVRAADRLLPVEYDPVVRTLVAKALEYKGITFLRLGRSEEAITAYDEVIRREGNATEPVLQERVARVLLHKGATLGELGRIEEAIAVYGEVVRRSGEATAPALRKLVANSLYVQGLMLGVLGRSEEAIAIYDEILRRDGEAGEPALREYVAKTLIAKGLRFLASGRIGEAIAAYDEVVRREGEVTEPVLREQVAEALFSKGSTLGPLGRREEAVAVYDEVIRREGGATEPALRELVAKALLNKGVTLRQLGRGEAAIAAYDEVVRREVEATEPALRELAAQALVGKGILLFKSAAGESSQSALVLKSESREALARAEQLWPGSGSYNLACVAAVDGEASEAVRWLNVAAAHGRVTREKVEQDSDFDGIRNHPALVEFLDSLEGSETTGIQAEAEGAGGK
jgi:tetratricopeptide (TPR) repeat protein